MRKTDTNPLRCMVSIIIPVMHEQETINILLKHLSMLRTESPFEIIVVDGSSTHDTLDSITQKGVLLLSSEPGRGQQMNQGAASAKGDILLFLHADTALPSNAIESIHKILQDERLVGGAFDVDINSQKFIYKIFSRLISLRSRVTRVPFGDQAIFLRKKYFDKTGGYKEIPLMEDVELMRRIRKNGDAICLLRDRVVTSSRRWECEGIMVCTLRNWMIRTLYTLRVNPKILVRFYD